jgi:hypothetical protein
LFFFGARASQAANALFVAGAQQDAELQRREAVLKEISLGKHA